MSPRSPERPERQQRPRRLWLGFLLGLLAAAPGWAQSVPPECGVLANAYGPFDYRTDRTHLGVVETYHFNADVEQLRRGLSAMIGGDLNYTLRAFPNHHRALMSMVRLSARDKTTKPPGLGFSVDCFLLRAETFRPDDAMVKVIYGIYLLNQGQTGPAVGKLEAARDLGVESPNVYYNLGLAYLAAGYPDKALTSAHKAYQLGFPLPGLRDKLKRAGKWRDPPPAAPPVVEEAARPADALPQAAAPAAPPEHSPEH